VTQVPNQLPTQTRLETAEKKIRESSFRENKGLGNEVGYYVFDYPASDELIVREWINYWQEKINPNMDGFQLIVFDLFETMISLLNDEGYLEQFISFEKEYGMDYVIEAFEEFFMLDDDSNVIVEHIISLTPDNSVVFLTGVGKCYPFLRSHKVLNNLHQKLDHVPVVMFFPGEYNGQELILFGNIKDDNYYRAFRLVE